MFIGHAALGFAAKKFAPRTPLGTLVFAATFADVLWPFLLLAGMETVAIAPGITKVTPLDFISYPWSHSLLMMCVWALAIAAVYFLSKRYKAGAVAVALLVPSHWILDWITHRPDMPLVPSGPVYGLSLWNNVPATLISESVLFVVGIFLYLSSTRAGTKASTVAMWGYIGFYLLAYAANFFSPPPPSVQAIAIVGVLGSFTVFWAHWFDKKREAIAA